MTTIMLKNTRTCDVTLDGVTIQAGRTQALEAAHVEQLRQHPGIGLWFDKGYLVEQTVAQTAPRSPANPTDTTQQGKDNTNPTDTPGKDSTPPTSGEDANKANKPRKS
ncbi:MAG TPA: hypothetical protein ACQGQW_00220 [Xylella fastidiosa subsp. pauca]